MARLPAPLFVAALLLPLRPLAGQGNTDVERLGRDLGRVRPPAAYFAFMRVRPDAFRFSPDNGWSVRARRLALARSAARAAALAAPGTTSGGDALRGALHLPVLPVMFLHTDSAQLTAAVPREALATRLFGTDPAPPYSVHSYYREVSDDRLLVTADVFDWIRLPESDFYYEGGCNGICATGRMGDLIRDAVARVDPQVDFGLYDSDGPDGIPNSGDDDGYVDGLVLLHAEVDGACGGLNLWAHRWTYAAWTGEDLLTDDASARAGFGPIRIRDYVIQGGRGGDDGCTAGAPQAMGILAHELGHLLGLPDLYDTSQESAGIGGWGLMGSGNWQVPARPASLSAWARAELGWVTELVIPRRGPLDLPPVLTGDTVALIPLPGGREYFLLENRRRLGVDSAMRGQGLLIWHVDRPLVDARRPTNTINATLPRGIALEQADGRNDLGVNANRGDASDPWPGAWGRTVFGPGPGQPTSHANNREPSGITLRDITEHPDGRISAYLDLLNLTVLASDTAARVRVNGEPYAYFQGATGATEIVTVGIDSVQTRADGRTRWIWEAWSHGAPRVEQRVIGDTIARLVATVRREHRVRVSAGPGGRVTVGDRPPGPVDVFLPEGSRILLTATPDAGYQFHRWSGDLRLSVQPYLAFVGRPMDIHAEFAAVLIAQAVPRIRVWQRLPFEYQLTATGGGVPPIWEAAHDDTLPPGVRVSALGVIQGRPDRAGLYAFRVRAISGPQADTTLVVLEVQPSLAERDVLAALAGRPTSLSPDAVAWLDRIGNRNGRLDVGDFLAWYRLPDRPGTAVPADRDR